MLHAFCINLDRRHDRRAFMERQFAALGLSPERIAATSPQTIREEDHAPFALSELLDRLAQAELAISISHFGVWRRMLDEGLPAALIFEDDVGLSPALPNFLEWYSRQAKCLGTVRLETRRSVVPISRWSVKCSAGLRLHHCRRYETGMAAYIIDADSARRVLASDFRFDMPVDDVLFSLQSRRFDPQRILQVVPALALCQHDPAGIEPKGVFSSDASKDRKMRFAAIRERRKRNPALRIWREILRILGRTLPRLNFPGYRTMKIPFLEEPLTAPPSAAPPPA